MRPAHLLLDALFLVVFPAPAAEVLLGESLVRALRDGGYHIYFRHTQTGWS